MSPFTLIRLLLLFHSLELLNGLKDPAICGTVNLTAMFGRPANYSLAIPDGGILSSIAAQYPLLTSVPPNILFLAKGSTSSPACTFRLCDFRKGLNQVPEFCEEVSQFGKLMPGKVLINGTIPCTCSDIDCDAEHCDKVGLQPHECARLYKEPFCKSCSGGALVLNRIDGPRNQISNIIPAHRPQSAVVNAGCDLHVERYGAVIEPLPENIQIFKAGSVHLFPELKPLGGRTVYKCFCLDRPVKVKVAENRAHIPWIAVIGSTVGVLLVVLLALFLGWKKLVALAHKLTHPALDFELEEFFEGRAPAESSHTYVTASPVNDLPDGHNGPDPASGFIEAVQGQPYNPEWEISRKFVEKWPTVLGRGEFGKVYRGLLKLDSSGTPVPTAIKIATGDQIRSLLMEIKILSYLGAHPNVVVMLRASVEEFRERKCSDVWLLLQLCENGSLKSFLDKNRDNFIEAEAEPSSSDPPADMSPYMPVAPIHITTRNLIQWAAQIASGMYYLEQLKVVHMDLAARNVLLDGDLVAKIGDFGLARKLYSKEQYSKHINPTTHKTSEGMPFKWMAPESLESLTFTSKSDTWAYGVLLWELFSLGQEPYPNVKDSGQLRDFLGRGNRLPRPDPAYDQVWRIIGSCWNSVPALRPGFERLEAAFLENIHIN